MKKFIPLILFIIALLGISNASQAQAAPKAFKYQAVVRNSLGKIVADREVSFRISILKDNINGLATYIEEHIVTTNSLGMVHLNIGDGIPVTGDMALVDWGTGPHFLQIELDIDNQGIYEMMGTSQLLSVPYALYAERAGNSNDNDPDPTNELQDISLNGNDLTISGGSTITLPSGTDTDPTNELQNLSINGGNLSISGGNTVMLPGSMDTDPTNELQDISINGNNLTISSGSTVTLPNDGDGDATNELQDISINGNNLTISSGSTVTLPSDGDGDATNELQDISINGNDLTISSGSTITLPSDGDGDATNELQNLTIAGNTLTISAGNSILLPTGGGTLDAAYDFGGAGQGRSITVDAGEVEMISNTTNSIALRTENTNTGVAILANTSNTTNTFSTIQASSSSNSSIASAVIGNSNGLAWGVSGQVAASATSEAGVYGSNLRPNGGHGVFGIGFNGIVGQTNYSTGYGVFGENFDANLPLGNGVGVGGLGYYGVLGEDRYLGGAFGAFGVYANGDMGASGVKAFHIDHPTDPENKFLRHFSIESDEVLNVYRGTIDLDANGEAVVELPDYFEAINREVSYQLTPIGSYAPLYIKEKVDNGQFVIAGGQAGMEVSWSVYAERNDLYLQQHPEKRTVEMDKRPQEQGKYLMPHLHNKGTEDAIFQHPASIEQKEMPILGENEN